MTKDLEFWQSCLKQSIEAAFELKDYDRVQVDFQILSPQDMQHLNQETRQIDKPTDVLSFPLYSRKDLEAVLTEPKTPILLGTLAICPEVIEERAKQEDREFDERALWSIAHGLKHLLGFDHDETGDNWFISTK